MRWPVSLEFMTGFPNVASNLHQSCVWSCPTTAPKHGDQRSQGHSGGASGHTMPRGTPKAHKRQHKKAQRWIQLVRTQANTIKSVMAQTINQSRAPLEQHRSVNRGGKTTHNHRHEICGPRILKCIAAEGGTRWLWDIRCRMPTSSPSRCCDRGSGL